MHIISLVHDLFTTAIGSGNGEDFVLFGYAKVKLSGQPPKMAEKSMYLATHISSKNSEANPVIPPGAHYDRSYSCKVWA
jgi:hypothetical protein